MKSYPILVLLFSLFVNDAMAATRGEQNGVFVLDASLATNKNASISEQEELQARPQIFAQTPRVYHSAKQFRESLKAGYS
jgi:hypothetical protein